MGKHNDAADIAGCFGSVVRPHHLAMHPGDHDGERSVIAAISA
jgi:hypothetical protein